TGPARRHIVLAGPAELEPAQTVERVAAPRAVIDALPHRLAELAVARDVDAEIPLMAHDIANCRAKPLLKFGLGACPISFAEPVGLDQIVGARQAAGMAGQDAVGAGSHDLPRQSCRVASAAPCAR